MPACASVERSPGTSTAPRPERQRPLAEDVEREPDPEQRDEHAPHEARRDREPARRLHRVDDEHDAPQREEADPEGEPAEGDHLRDGLGGDAPGGVEPVAHRAARQHGVAERDGEGVADERRQRAPAVGQPLARVPQRQRVVARQHDVVDDRQRQRRRDAPRRERAEVGPDVPRVEAAELVAEQPQRGDEDQDAEEGRESAESVHAAASGAILRRALESRVPRSPGHERSAAWGSNPVRPKAGAGADGARSCGGICMRGVGPSRTTRRHGGSRRQRPDGLRPLACQPNRLSTAATPAA